MIQLTLIIILHVKLFDLTGLKHENENESDQVEAWHFTIGLGFLYTEYAGKVGIMICHAKKNLASKKYQFRPKLKNPRR